MKRRTALFGCFLFIAGLLALDVALIDRQNGLHQQVDQALTDLIGSGWSYDDVELGFNPLRGPKLIVKGLVVTRNETSREPLIQLESVALGLDYSALYEGRIQLERVEIVKPQVHLYWKEGELDLKSPFKSQAGPAGDLPTIDARGLSFHLHDPPFLAATPGRPVVIEPIEIKLERALSASYPYRFEGAIKDPVFGTFRINGSLRNDKIDGHIRRENLSLNAPLVAMFDEKTQALLDGVEMENGIDLDLAFRSEDASDRVRLQLGMRADRVVIRHHRLPTEIKELVGDFELRNGVVRARPLRFELNGAEVRVRRGEIRLPTAPSESVAIDLEARISGLDIGPSFVDSIRHIQEEPFPDIREALEAFGAAGNVNLDLALMKPSDSSRVGVDADVVFDRVALAYEGYADPVTGERTGYPYRVRNLYGHVHIDNGGLRFDELITRCAEDFVRLDGNVVFGETPGFRIDVVGNNIHLDDNVRDALPPAEREVYDSYAPGGRADLQVHVSREPGEPSTATRVEVGIDMRLVEARPEIFPLNLESIGGRLEFKKGQPARLTDIHAVRGEGTISLDGQVDFASESSDEGFALKLKARDIDLDDDLVAAVGVAFPEVAAEMRRQDMRGRFDLDAVVGEGGAKEDRFDLRLRGMHLRLNDAPSLPLENIYGRADVTEGQLRLRDLNFQILGRPLRGEGDIGLGDDPSWRVKVKGERLSIDPTLMSDLGRELPFAAKMARRFDVEGVADLELELKRNRRGELVKSEIDLAGLRLRDREGPLVVKDLNGRLTTRNGAITLENATAVIPWHGPDPAADVREADRATLSILQAVLREGEALDLTATGVSMTNLVLREEVIALLPESAQSSLRELGVKGRLDFELSTLRHREGRTIFRGQLRPEGLRGNTDVNLVLERGQLDVELGEIEGDDFRLQGQLRGGAAKIFGFRMEDMESPFDLGNRRVSLSRLGARFLTGRLEPPGTRFSIDFERGRAFDARISALELDLSDMLRQLGGRPSAVKGRANLNAGLGGRLGDLDSYVGEANVKMTGRALYELPFFTTVFQIINFDFLTTSSNEPQRGQLDLRVRDRVFLLDRARFEGPGINMDGSGRAGFDGIIDLAFEPKPIKWVDSIPIVGELFEIGSGIIVDKVHLTGPIENPKARVGNYLTEILPAERDAGRRLIIRPLKKKGGGKTENKSEKKR